MERRERIRHLVLIGLMGSGKTSVGHELARGLGWPYRDNDATLAAEAGGTPLELQREVGVERMHELEAEQLLAALAEPDPSVVGAAASTIEDDRCLAALRAPDLYVVWLSADPSVLGERARRGGHRPHLADDLDALLREQLERRRPRYESVADLVIDASTESPDELAARIRRSLEPR